MDISAIVPCYNEEKSLALFYQEFCRDIARIEGVSYELILVDDGSTDGTLREMKELAAKDSHVRYLSFSRNFGKESAIYAGLENARGDFCVLMDADLQDPPSLLPEMYGYVKDGEYDSVATRRVTRKGEPKIRSFFARQFYKLMSRISKVDLVDGARDYRLTSFARSGERNHGDYNIKVYARSISEAEYRFRRNLESSSTGFNLFTPNPGEIAGNVSCEEVPSEHVYGYISTSSSSSIEAVLDQRYLKAMTPNPYSLVVPSPSVDLSVYLNGGMWPVAWMMLGDSMPVGWGKLRCIDCIEAGGTLEKPEFLN